MATTLDDSPADEHDVELAHAFGVGDEVDRDDPPIADRAAGHPAGPPTRRPDRAGRAVHQRRMRCSGASRRPGRHPRGPTGLPGRPYAHGGVVGPHYDVRVEQRQQRVEVAAAGRGEEGIDDLSLMGEVQLRIVGPVLDPTPGTTRQLSCRVRGSPHDLADLVEGDGEDVVQHEGDALGGRQKVEHHE
jgi:hypothetical protein